MASYNHRYEKPPSAAVLAGRARRLARAAQVEANTEFFISEILDKVNTSMRKRVKIATELVKSKVIRNISRPVTKAYMTRRVTYVDDKGKNRTRTEHSVSISDRSKPGEFPKADTVQLLKTIFSDYQENVPGECAGFVGTPLDYGVVLELQMDRSFLVRTLYEEMDKVLRILNGPM